LLWEVHMHFTIQFCIQQYLLLTNPNFVMRIEVAIF
jgi:hypothetical protein